MLQHATAPTRARRAGTSVAAAGPRRHSLVDAPVETLPEAVPESGSEATTAAASDAGADAVSGAPARVGREDVDLTARVGRLELENLQLRMEILRVHLLLLAMERGAPLSSEDPDAAVIQAQINALRDRIENF